MARTSRQHATSNTQIASAELLLEVGTEELPYQFMAPALHALVESTERLLKDHRLTYGAVRSLGTPRRLVLVVESLACRQAPAVKEVLGPSKSVAFDPAGQPTKAAIGFAASQGVAVSDLEIRQTPKGEYIAAVKREQGRQVMALLPAVLSALIGSLSFPKSMRWNDSGVRFARPIRWLLALYSGRVIPMEIGGVKAGTRTWGHRFLGSRGTQAGQGVPVKDRTSYLKALERRGVIVDQDRRRAAILKQLDSLAKAARGHLHCDEELLEQAVFTVEYPHAILGSFNLQYLSLPKEVIMAAMKEHQGYFSLLRNDGSLLPQFVSVTNMKLANMTLIREGNERVLAARLADAKFYFDEDRKVKLAERVEKLKQMTLHQKLGTLYQKTLRVVQLASTLAEPLGGAHLAQVCERAARLSKADLLTGIVGEFPALQGLMGGEYATHDGETEEVGQAIREQYLPRGMEGDLPQSLPGKILSLADRLDTIAAFFHVGLVPSGSEDPFGLRRHAAAVVRILIEGNLRVNLADLLAHTKRLVQQDGFKGVDVAGADPATFIAERLRYYGRTIHRVRDDVMDAVLKGGSVGLFNLVDLLSRVKALQQIATRTEFDPLIAGFKRAHRLVEKERWERHKIDIALFQHPAEHELYHVLVEGRSNVPAALAKGDYDGALNALVGMKSPIDKFFDGVMVNAEDKALRANRLSLLYEVDQLFLSFADFSQIVVQGV